ncbi:unnamed protein product [Closterium sp. NIES-53]
MAAAEAASYLVSLTLSPDQANHCLARCPRLAEPSTLPNQREVVAFLLDDLHFSAKALPPLLRRCPQLLAYSVPEKLRPAAECLRGVGFTARDLRRAIAHFPGILARSIEEKLCPLLALLQHLDIAEEKCRRVILACPRLVSYSIDVKMRPLVHFFQSNLPFSPSQVGRMVTRCPQILGCNLEKQIIPAIGHLRGIGLIEDKLLNLLLHHPYILCRSVGKTLEPRTDFLLSLGFTRAEVARIVADFPPILTKHVDNDLRPKLAYLEGPMGRSVREVLGFPRFFSFSLARRIIPNHRKLQSRGREDRTLVELCKKNV